MGFCKRCGDIINKEKCDKCGGAAVSGVVKFNGPPGTPKRADRWEKKYTHRRSASPAALQALSPNTLDQRYPTSPTKRPRRPLSVDITGRFEPVPPAAPDHVKAHTDSESAAGPVVPMEDGLTLAKVHGTVLLPPPPLRCAHCSAVFPPNATLYPLDTASLASALILEPDTVPSLSGAYACLPCWSASVGLVGPCAACDRPVLRLKSEGRWITVRDRVWHARCFMCEGCGLDLSRRPMVGVAGGPECEECFGKVLRGRSGRKSGHEGEKEREKGRAKEAVNQLNTLFNTPPTTPSKALARPSPRTAPTTPGAPPPSLSPSALCPICVAPLLPPPGQTAPLINAAGKQYHAQCFVCSVCAGPFVEDGEGEGAAVFVFIDERPAHPACAPAVQTPTASPSRQAFTRLQKTPTPATTLPAALSPAKKPSDFPAPSSPSKRSTPTLALPRALSRSPSKPRPTSLHFPAPLGSTAAPLPRPASPLKSPVFGGAGMGVGMRCACCGKGVSPMERGTVPGPGGGRWHAGCLRCGAERKGDEGAEAEAENWEALLGNGNGKANGCGKKLDSGAKEAAGRVWCRSCWDDLPSALRPASPTRAASMSISSPLAPMHTGLALALSPTLSRSPSKTGTGTGLSHAIFPRAHQRSESLGLGVGLQPQLTGSGLPITRQLTGSAFGPGLAMGGLTRQVTGTGNWSGSPTKDGNGDIALLVRQMTGNAGTNANGIVSPAQTQTHTRRPRPRSMYAPAALGLGRTLENVMED